MLSLRHFRDKLLYNNIKHCTGSKAQKIWQHRYYKLSGKYRQHCSDWFHNTGQHTTPKRSALTLSLCTKRHRNNRALREVLNSNTDGQGKRPCCRN